MTIDEKQLVKDGVLLAQPDEPVGAVLDRLPRDRDERVFVYVVFPATRSTYHVVQWRVIEELARKIRRNILSVPISELVGLPPPVPAVEQDSMSIQEARELRDEQKPVKVLVVLRDGAFFGLLLFAPRQDTDIGSDPFQREDAAGVLGPDVPSVPPAAPEPLATPDVPSPAVPAPAQDDRVINAWIEDEHVKQGKPLQVGEAYDLKFNVDSPRAGATTTLFNSDKAFTGLAPDVNQVEITVVLDSDDVEIIGDDQARLIVPRKGKSRNTATFTISPTKNGTAGVRALFFANNRVFQKMTIQLQVGTEQPAAAIVQVEASGKTFGSATIGGTPFQELDLIILARDAGYEFILQSGSFKRATVNLSQHQIVDLVASAREELKKVVYAKDSNRFVYQLADTDIPATVHAQSLKTLMGIGVDLFEGVFFAPGNGADAQEIGNLLRQRSRATKLNVAIVAERFAFPWALLYDRDYDPDHVEPDGFWGFKHVIEYTPEFHAEDAVHFAPEISVDSSLELGFVLNTTIDDELKRKGFQGQVIQPQREFFSSLDGVTVTEYPNSGDFYKLLRNTNPKTQFIYFYCHAESALPGATGGVDASKVILSDGPVTLKDMKRNAPLSRTTERFDNCPLVFLNACESAELSPHLYDGMVPYLIAKGARGVIGTEVNTPALFAAEFAQEFLKRFLAGGQPIGELLLQMRREYRDKKNNVMGLVYALHTGAAVVVQRH